MVPAHATASDTQAFSLEREMADLFVRAQGDDDALLALSARFKGLTRFERTPNGEIVVMAPESLQNSGDGSELHGALFIWNAQAGRPGKLFGSQGGWHLADGSVRSPDVAWITIERWNQYTDTDNPPPFGSSLAPDFVIEVMSPRDSRPAALAKMQHWRRNGVRLGWLIDPVRHLAWVFRSGEQGDPAPLERPDSLSGEDVLPGFTADLTVIWREPDHSGDAGDAAAND